MGTAERCGRCRKCIAGASRTITANTRRTGHGQIRVTNVIRMPHRGGAMLVSGAKGGKTGYCLVQSDLKRRGGQTLACKALRGPLHCSKQAFVDLQCSMRPHALQSVVVRRV